MKILIKNKKQKEKMERIQLWYDPFFKENVYLNCDGYTIKTKYSPYCIFNNNPIKINKAIDIFKKHNKINYDNDYVFLIMKSKNLIYYDYIQEPHIFLKSKTNEFSKKDLNKILYILNNCDLTYSTLNTKSEGFSIEIDEINKNKESTSNIDDFLLQIDKDYDYEEI